jgi:hypothetical protein
LTSFSTSRNKVSASLGCLSRMWARAAIIRRAASLSPVALIALLRNTLMTSLYSFFAK